MADGSKPTFSFGQTSNTGSDSTPTPFGQSNTGQKPAGGGLFGSNTPASTGSGLFGSTQPASTGGSLFGNAAGGSSTAQTPLNSTAGNASGGGLFGGAASSQPSSIFNFTQPPAQSGTSLFGSTSNTQMSQAPASSGSATASSFATPSKPVEGSGDQAQTPKPLFGAASGATGGSLFNLEGTPAVPSTTPAGKSTSLFGTSTTPAGPPPGSSIGTGAPAFSFGKPAGGNENLFGAKPANDQPAAPSLFSAPKPAATTTASTDASQSTTPNPTSTSTNLFANKSSTAQGGSLFDNLGKPQTEGGDKPSLFGNLGKPQTDSAPKPSLFGNLGKPRTENGDKPSLFGNLGKPQAAAGDKPALGQQTSQLGPNSDANASATPAAASAPKFSFGAPNATSQSPAPAPAAAAAPSAPSSLFSAPKAPEKPATATAPTAAPSSTPAAPPAAPTTQSTFGGFPKPTPAASAPSQEPPQSASAQGDATKKTNLSASTIGPAPPQQSRLKNKSMDELITRWATDLSKYQKEFQGQAEKVARWDRMLVENSEKIQKLYGQTLEAERAMTEVERQLHAVESDQSELESWLDYYSKEMDNMIKQQGDGDAGTGPDAERQRTYQLAGRLTEKLDGMGQDLTSMIEEINDASSNLSKNSKEDDPLSQVVRVLNNHLTQLQQIDQGASALSIKIQESQKSAKRMGALSNGSNPAFGNARQSDAADGFWKSYMGRR